ncbi:MAG TPA: NAD(P)H-dependent glycerol-3-phosphate dehydrogenase [Trueperaceae bacterium]|nr:NAD(P)H-dependent glycerol-3-phosphate dehydrogenase [Trueperaceae bacterium]
MSQDASGTAAVSVIGAGAWGTTIAWLLANNGHDVRLWTRDRDLADSIARDRRNAKYLPALKLQASISPTSDLAVAMSGGPIAFAAVPARALRGVLKQLTSLPAAVVSCAKGVEPVDSERGAPAFKRLSQVVVEELPEVPAAALSGPNLASEIAAGLPAATTVACESESVATSVQALLQQSTFRVYTSTDLVGVELGGVMKNVIAIAAGICDGLGLGDNAKSTIITRGLAETIRFGVHLGGQERTFYGLAGLGDVVATCMSPLSRNHEVGFQLALGENIRGSVIGSLTAEGVGTVAALHGYAAAHGLEMPITTEVYKVAYEGKDPREAMETLMTRESKAE